MTRPPKPFMEELDEAADPSTAPPVPDALPDGQAMQAVAALSQKRGSVLTRFAIWAFGALFSFALSVAAYDFVVGLLARNVVLGWAAFALVVVAVAAGMVLALREWGAFLRLGRLDALRTRAVEARAAADLKEARRVVSGLAKGKFEIAFPWQMVAMLKLARILPYRIFFRYALPLVVSRSE